MEGFLAQDDMTFHRYLRIDLMTVLLVILAHQSFDDKVEMIFDFTGSYRAAFLNSIGWNLLNLTIAFWLLRRTFVQRALAAG